MVLISLYYFMLYCVLSTVTMSSHCFLASMVLDEMSVVNLMRNPCIWWVTFLLLISRFSLCLSTVCLGEYHIEFIIFGVYWVSWMCCFFIKLESFLTIFSSNIPSAPICLDSFWTFIVCMLDSYWWCSLGLWGSVKFSSFFFFLFLRLDNFN